jgi:hypothetical protein
MLTLLVDRKVLWEIFQLLLDDVEVAACFVVLLVALIVCCVVFCISAIVDTSIGSKCIVFLLVSRILLYMKSCKEEHLTRFTMLHFFCTVLVSLLECFLC